MRRPLIISIIVLSSVVIGFKLMEYYFLNGSIHFGIYIGIIVSVALGFGLWVGKEFFSKQQPTAETPSTFNQKSLQDFGLSSREAEILVLIEKGMTNQEIADQLFVSLSTIKTHTSNIYAKLSVKNRTQAIVKARSITPGTKV